MRAATARMRALTQTDCDEENADDDETADAFDPADDGDSSDDDHHLD